MSTLLTIDLDYWTMRDACRGVVSSCVKFVDRALRAAQHARWIDYHDELVAERLIGRHIDKVVNVDRHNDYVVPGRVGYDRELNEGNWVNHLPRQVKSYEWRHPFGARKHRSVCADWCEPASSDPADYPLPWSHCPGLHGLMWQDVSDVVVCHSPNWGSRDLQYEILTRLVRLNSVQQLGWELH